MSLYQQLDQLPKAVRRRQMSDHLVLCPERRIGVADETLAEVV